MQMRYFQQLWQITHQYEEWVEIYESAQNPNENESLVRYNQIRLKHAEQYIGPYHETKEEYEAVRYLANLRLGIAHDNRAVKPDTEIINRALKRYLTYLEDVHGVVRNTKRTDHNSLALKEMKCCYYYLFKFSLPAWVEKLPPYIPTFEEKHERKIRKI